jgi:hypothetical protein
MPILADEPLGKCGSINRHTALKSKFQNPKTKQLKKFHTK